LLLGLTVIGVRARGLGCSPPDSGKATTGIFRAEASSQRWKIYICIY